MSRGHGHLFMLIMTLFLFAALLAACLREQPAATLNDVETYIQIRPDSALSVLQSIDTVKLTTRRLRAHFALLHAIALDKNRIDTTEVGVVMPAVEYYSKRGTADQKMKAFYYLGRIQENKKDLNASIVSYTVAEECAVFSLDERFKGMLECNLADSYQKAYYFDKALECLDRGLEHFHQARDTMYYAVALGRLADVYQSKRDWNKADSLYKECLEYLVNDTVFSPIFLSHYASMKALQPEADPEGANDLLRRKVLGGRSLTIGDYAVYAYSCLLLGEDNECDEVLRMIINQPEAQRKRTRYKEYRIAEYRGNYLEAIELLKASYLDQDTIVANVLSNSVVQSLQNFYARRVSESTREMKEHRHFWMIASLLFLSLFGAVFFWFLQRHEKEKQTAEKVIRAYEETNKMLKNDKELLENDIGRLQITFVDFYQTQLERIGLLCEAYVRGRNRLDQGKMEAVYRRVERIVEDINKDDESYVRFEYQVNQYLGNVVEQLKSDLAKKYKINSLDARFICYSIAGFDSNTISLLLGISLQNVYTRRSRLKERIRQLDTPHRERYLKHMRL